MLPEPITIEIASWYGPLPCYGYFYLKDCPAGLYDQLTPTGSLPHAEVRFYSDERIAVLPDARSVCTGRIIVSPTDQTKVVKTLPLLTLDQLKAIALLYALQQ